MANINFYKIEEGKEESFEKELDARWEVVSQKTVKVDKDYELTLYLPLRENTESKPVVWTWITVLFGEDEIPASPAPRAIVVIDMRGQGTYACTFGCAYYAVDKFCDTEWGFQFGSRLKYKDIKTSTISNPNAKRNKTVNTYIDESELSFNSGESYKKLKAKCILSEGFSLFNETVEIGNSIKISSEDVTLDKIVRIIQYINDVIAKSPILHKIPVFMKVRDEEFIEELEDGMRAAVSRGDYVLDLSELEIIGVTEIFRRTDGKILLQYEDHKYEVSELTDCSLHAFCNEFNLDYISAVFDIRVRTLDENGKLKGYQLIKELIDYTDEGNKCVLSHGNWFRYNDDYLTYLEDTVETIPTEYNPEYDFPLDAQERIVRERQESENLSYDDAKRRYYKEFSYNIWMSEKHNFQLGDRCYLKERGYKLEVQDLYKDGVSYAVKFGAASSKLAYVVDQSITAFEKIRRKEGDFKNIQTMALMINLGTHPHLSEREVGGPSLNDLNLLIFKNRLVDWAYKVRMYGYDVKVFVNYCTDAPEKV